ncbi:MAG: FAD-binding oxidoreductase, partial [Burkholderiaceae bacterium]
MDSTLAALRAAREDLSVSDAPAELETLSRDYYWYSPILTEALAGKRGELIVRPASQAQVVQVAAACAKHRVPLTVRGGGTGNYGQCVPLAGGVILDTSLLNQIISIQPGMATVQTG